MPGLLNSALVNIFERRVRTGQIDPDTWRHCVEALQRGLAAGGAGTASSGFLPSGQPPIVSALQWNTLMVAAFKNHNQTVDLVRELIDPRTGLLRTWAEFRAAALPIVKNYNINWLKTEYQTATNAGLNALQWQDYQAQRNTYPYLTYITMRDGRVRDTHRVLDRITRHLDDPFWDEYYPPNGWSCRCSTKQSRGPETPVRDHARSEKDFPPAFRINPGKTGQIFSPEHPYFKGMSAAMRDTILRQVNKMLHTDAVAAPGWAANSTSTVFTYFKNYPDHIGLDDASGGFVAVHEGHQYRALIDEMPALLHLRNRGQALWLLDDKLPSKPDLFWDGKTWELKRMHKSTNPIKSVKNYFQSASKNHADLLIHLDQDIQLHSLIDAVKNGSRQYEGVKTVRILANDGSWVHLDKQAMKSGIWPEPQ